MSLSTLADLVGAMIPVQALWIVFEASLKGSVLLLAAWAAVRMLRGASAALRHLIWATALGGMLLMPLASIVLPPLRISGLPELDRAAVIPTVAEAVVSPAPTSTIEAPENATAVVAIEPAHELPPPVVDVTRPQSIGRYVPLLWLTIAGLVLLRLIVGTLRVSTWTRRARVVDEGEWLSLAQRMAARLRITRPVTLLRSDRACVPMTWGVVYPTVLLPMDADQWPSERRMIVLLHELAHVKRFDAFTQLIAQFAVALFWFNPLVWLAARQMRTEREHACDDCVLEGGARATDYAYDLLQIARSLGGSSAPAAAALAMARQSEFEGRLLAILDPKTNRNTVSRARLVVATVGALVLALPLAAMRSAPAAVERSIAADEPQASVVAIQSPAPIVPIATTPEPTPPVLVAPSEPTPQAVELTPLPPDVGSLTPAPIVTTPSVWSSAIPRPLITPAPIRQSGQQQQRGEATQPPPDRETLIAVARQAAKMKSDYDKAELLITVAKHYIRDDELRTAYLDAVASIRSSYDQSRTLLPMMLRDDLPSHAVAQVVRIAAQMSSDNDKATLLVTTITEHDAIGLSTCDAIIGAAGTIRSDYDRSRTIAAILKRGELSNSQLVDLIGVIKPMTGSYDKANALVSLSKRFLLTDNEVRTAFFQAAETISSATDYRRVMQGVLK